MKSRFEHEINMGRNFLHQLETYLSRDHFKAREDAESKILDMEVTHKEEIEYLRKELRDAQLIIAKNGLEKGRLLNQIDELKGDRGEVISGD